MRAAVLTGFFACVFIIAASSTSVSAETTNINLQKQFQGVPVKTGILASINLEPVKPVKPAPPVAVPEPKVHVVGPNENLSTIAQKYNISWQRVYDKNLQLDQPDFLTVGDKLAVPLAKETLAPRALPEPPVIVATASVAKQAEPSAPIISSPARQIKGSSNGNTYTAGYCTWYAKAMRPDLPNNLGNANTWVARASAQGLPTGSTPRVGAIGQQGMHVVYVERVNNDGTVFVSEMNFKGLYVNSTRTVAASNFQYIY